MAPKDTKIDDFAFLVACLKNTPDLRKPDFDKVAEEIGADNGKACYYRHWSLLKKLGIVASKATASSTVGRKRGRPKKTDCNIGNEMDAELDDKPAKKAKASPKKKEDPKIIDVEEDEKEQEDEA